MSPQLYCSFYSSSAYTTPRHKLEGGVVVFFFLVTIIEMFFSILNKNVNLTEKMTGNVYFQAKYIQGAICLKAS